MIYFILDMKTTSDRKASAWEFYSYTESGVTF